MSCTRGDTSRGGAGEEGNTVVAVARGRLFGPSRASRAPSSLVCERGSLCVHMCACACACAPDRILRPPTPRCTRGAPPAASLVLFSFWFPSSQLPCGAARLARLPHLPLCTALERFVSASTPPPPFVVLQRSTSNTTPPWLTITHVCATWLPSPSSCCCLVTDKSSCDLVVAAFVAERADPISDLTSPSACSASTLLCPPHSLLSRSDHRTDFDPVPAA